MTSVVAVVALAGRSEDGDEVEEDDWMDLARARAATVARAATASRMTKDLIVDIQEGRSFKRAMRRPHRAVLRLRSLVCRGRATLARMPRGRQDYAIEFLVNPDVPNEVCWNILSFRRAST